MVRRTILASNPKERIWEAAPGLFAQSGYPETSLHAIAKQLTLEFYGPTYLLYPIYDDAKNKKQIVPLFSAHINRFIVQTEYIRGKAGTP